MGNKRLSRLSGWQIAEKLGVHYTGDMNVVDHGGMFYKLDELEHDYIPCVCFSEADGIRYFEIGSIPIYHATWEQACKLVRECLEQFQADEREKLAEMPTFAHVMTEYLRFQNGCESDGLVWFDTDEAHLAPWQRTTWDKSAGTTVADCSRPKVDDGRDIAV